MNYLARGAQKVWLESLSCAQRKKLSQKINPRDPVPYWEPKTPRCPNNANSVNADQIAAGNVRRKRRIPPHIDELRDVKANMLQSLPASHRSASQLDRFRHCQNVNGATQEHVTHSVVLRIRGFRPGGPQRKPMGDRTACRYEHLVVCRNSAVNYDNCRNVKINRISNCRCSSCFTCLSALKLVR
jgi:hypothetical protein